MKKTLRFQALRTFRVVCTISLVLSIIGLFVWILALSMPRDVPTLFSIIGLLGSLFSLFMFDALRDVCDILLLLANRVAPNGPESLNP